MKKVALIMSLVLTFGAMAQDSTVIKPKRNPVKEFKVWVNGRLLDADNLEVMCVEDDFETFANLKWTLKDSTGNAISQGYMQMKGEDYKLYLTRPNHGDRAVLFVMQELKLIRRQQAEANAARRAAAGTITNQ